MREIVYAGGRFVTADDIAEALFQYAAELANAARAATVHVPAVGTLGQTVDIGVVIGPSSQLLSAPSDVPETSLDGSLFIADVNDRLERLHRAHTNASALGRSPVDWDV